MFRFPCWKKARQACRLLALILLFFTLFISCLYLTQEHLLFGKRSITAARVALIRSTYSNAEEIVFRTPDNVVLHGWTIAAESEKSPLFIYFGGNSNLASEVLNFSEYLDGWTLVAVDYRGYGLSEGKPDEKKLYEDALLIYDETTSKPNIDKDRVVIMGYSLGSAIATYVASKRPVNGVILAAPFDSISNLVRNYIPLKIIELLVKHKFDSLSRAPSISVPCLVLAAGKDAVVPGKNTMNLVKHWKGETRLCLLKNETHRSLIKDSKSWSAVRQFLLSLPEKKIGTAGTVKY